MLKRLLQNTQMIKNCKCKLCQKDIGLNREYIFICDKDKNIFGDRICLMCYAIQEENKINDRL